MTHAHDIDVNLYLDVPLDCLVLALLQSENDWLQRSCEIPHNQTHVPMSIGADLYASLRRTAEALLCAE